MEGEMRNEKSERRKEKSEIKGDLRSLMSVGDCFSLMSGTRTNNKSASKRE